MFKSLQQYNSCQYFEYDDVINIKSNAETDFFNKYQLYNEDSAAFFFLDAKDDFSVKIKAKLCGREFADAVFLMVRDHKEKWIKLCLEYGVGQQYSVVSVVTNPWSDDANGEILKNNECWLRITRVGDRFGFHYSTDNEEWRFVREFGLNMSSIPMVGFGVQSPNSNGCEVVVSEFKISNQTVIDFRSGN